MYWLLSMPVVYGEPKRLACFQPIDSEVLKQLYS
jgi:hypothetical protein